MKGLLAFVALLFAGILLPILFIIHDEFGMHAALAACFLVLVFFSPVLFIGIIAGAIALVGFFVNAMSEIGRTIATKPILASAPPRSARYLLLLVPKQDREAILGDIEEEFRTVVLPQYGLRAARVYYWCQILALIVPYIIRFLKHVLRFAVVLKLIGK